MVPNKKRKHTIDEFAYLAPSVKTSQDKYNVSLDFDRILEYYAIVFLSRSEVASSKMYDDAVMYFEQVDPATLRFLRLALEVCPDFRKLFQKAMLHFRAMCKKPARISEEDVRRYEDRSSIARNKFISMIETLQCFQEPYDDSVLEADINEIIKER